MPGKLQLKPLPPKEAIDYFRKKGYKIGFDWRDVWQDEHAYAFTVAKAMRTDILQDIRDAVDTAIAEGTTLAEFKKQLRPTLQKKGWWGKKLVVDPDTKEEKLVQLGSSRRLRTIFDTNMRTAYAAGTWQRIQRVKKARPYLRYVAILDDRTRTQHRIWNDTIKPVDDPFWSKFYPPNGWGCRCTVQQLSQRDLDRLGLSVTKTDPATPDRTWIDKRNGVVHKVPQGIDPGFATNPGMARMRALTPPALNKPLDVPYHGPAAKLPAPLPRAVPKTALYPDGRDDEEYARRFLKEFDLKPGAAASFIDAAGDAVVISDDLFRTSTGKLKTTRPDKRRGLRGKYLGLLARAIKDPDEIWHVWEEYPKGRWTLRRKYLARFNVEGEDVPAFVLFDTNPNGWTGVTAFPPKKSRYLDDQRRGALVYRRPDE